MKLQKFRASFGRVVTGIGFLGLAALFVIVFVVAIDVILRKSTGSALRINGSNEITASFMIVLCSLWIPALQVKKGHIWVPLFVNKFPYRFRCFWVCSISLIETAIVLALANGAYGKALDLMRTGMSSDVLKMPMWVFAAIVFIAFCEYFILSVVDTIQYCIDGVKNNPSEAKKQE